MADLTIVMSSDEARVVRALDKIIQKEADLKAKAVETGKATEEAAKKAETALERWSEKHPQLVKGLKGVGSAAGDMAKDVGGALAGATSAADLLIQALRGVTEEARAASAAQRGGLQNQSLGQLAGGDAGKLRELDQKAANLFATGATKDLAGAKKLVFAMEQAGFTDQSDRNLVGAIGQLHAVENPDALVNAATIFRAAYGEKAGSFGQIASGAQAAAGVSVADLEPILAATGKGASQAAALKIRPAEFLAGLGLAARTSESPEEAATQLSAFMKEMETHPELQGKGLGGALDTIKGMNLSPEQLANYLPEVRGRRWYQNATAQRGLLGSLDRDVEAARTGGGGGIEGTLSALAQQPQLRSDVALQQEQNRAELERMGIAVEENAREAVRTRLDREDQQNGGWALPRAARRALREAGGKLPGFLSDLSYNDFATDQEKETRAKAKADADAMAAGSTSAVDQQNRYLQELVDQGRRQGGNAIDPTEGRKK